MKLVFRFLDSRGEESGVTKRDSFALNLLTTPLSPDSDTKTKKKLTDLEKKMTKIAASLLVAKVEERKREEEEEGIAVVSLMAGSKQIIGGVLKMKYCCVLFHSGQQLFLTVEGKGKKGLRVDAEWLGAGQVMTDYMAQRGFVSMDGKDLCLPLQCEEEGRPRWGHVKETVMRCNFRFFAEPWKVSPSLLSWSCSVEVAGLARTKCRGCRKAR